MDPDRLKPAVELPIRRARPLAFGVAVALLFAFGARNYVSSMRRCPYAARPTVRLDLMSDPPGATVVREQDGRTLCVTPCVMGVESRPGLTGLRFLLPGHATRRVPVNLLGGDTQIEAVLQPLR
jgi:hypothetical protein